LVCAQVAISIILLVPTGLFLKSLVNLMHVNLGIRTANVVGFRITPEWNGYKPAQSKALFERAEAELAAIPGVRSVAASSVPLIGNSNWGTSFSMEGMKPDAQRLNSKFNEVGPGFFGKAGIPLIAGREIRETDTAAAPKVMVVNETFVKQFFGGRNPIGQRVGFGKAGDLDTEIVGVVKDSHYSSVRQQPPPVFFRPWRQDDDLGSISFYVRSELPRETDRAADPRRDALHRPRRASGGCAHTGRAGAFQHRVGRADHAAGGGVRRAGDGSGNAGLVWRNGARGRAAYARDRHPHGAGRGAGQNPLDGHARDDLDSQLRTGSGNTDGLGIDATDREPAFRRAWEGRYGRRGRGVSAGAYGRRRCLLARSPRVTGEPAGGVAL
jgi:hypothetical protein